MNEQEQVGNSSSRTQRCSGPLSGWAESKAKPLILFVRLSVRPSVRSLYDNDGDEDVREKHGAQQWASTVDGGAAYTLRHLAE